MKFWIRAYLSSGTTSLKSLNRLKKLISTGLYIVEPVWAGLSTKRNKTSQQNTVKSQSTLELK